MPSPASSESKITMSSLARAAILVVGLFVVLQEFAFGHGTVTNPVSRVYRIYQEGPDSANSPSAVAAIAVAGSTPYYTWNQISQNVPDYNTAAFDSSYASVIPDGEIASGGNSGQSSLNFSGLDLVSDSWNWPATPVDPGPLEVNWYATAAHDPSFFKVWITTEDYDHNTPLNWDQLEYLGQPSHSKLDQNYIIPITLPARKGRHVLYVAWQRIDPVGEVFFSASDIIFSDDPVDPNADPVVSIESTTVNESDGIVSIRLSLSRPVAAGLSASIGYATSAGTALAGVDYTDSRGTVEFNSGEDSATISVPISDDMTIEGREVFSIALNTPINLVASTLPASVTIEDDDTIPVSESVWELRDDWGSGFNGWLSLDNNGSIPIENAILTFSFPADHRAVVVWGGPSVSDLGGGNYRVTGLPSIPAGGRIRIDLGVNSTSSGSERTPSNVRLNGSLVGVEPPVLFISRNQLRFESIPGVRYQLQSSADLTSWEDSGEPIIGSGKEIILDLMPLAETEKTRQFNRIRALP